MDWLSDVLRMGILKQDWIVSRDWWLSLIEFGARFLLSFVIPAIALWILKNVILDFIYARFNPVPGGNIADAEELEEDEETLLKEAEFHNFYLWIRLLIYLLYFVSLGLLGLYALNPDSMDFFRSITLVWKQALLIYGGTRIEVGNVLTFTFVLVILLALRTTIRSWLDGIVMPSVMGGATSRSYGKNRKHVVSLSYYTLLVFLFLFSLSFLGINVSSLAIVLSALGIGVGFGLKDLVENLFSGITLLIFRYMKEDDRIIVDTSDGPKEGTVVKVRLFSTVVQTLRKNTLIIPNSIFVRSVLVNQTYDTRSVIIPIKVRLDYEQVDDCALILDLLEEAGKQNPYRRHRGYVKAVILEIHNYYVHFELWLEISDINLRASAINWANQQIFKRLKEHNIRIPQKASLEYSQASS